jgi:hypothetical protein
MSVPIVVRACHVEDFDWLVMDESTDGVCEHYDSRRFQILLSEHESLMASERSFYTTAGTLVAVGGAFTGILAGVLALAPEHGNPKGAAVWVLLPLLPLLAVSYIAYLSVMGKIRGLYILAIEKALHVEGGSRIDLLPTYPQVGGRRKSLDKASSRTWTSATALVPAQHGVLLPLLVPGYGSLWISIVFFLPSVFGGVLAILTIVVAMFKIGDSYWQFLISLYSALFLGGLVHFVRIMSGKFDRDILEHSPFIENVVRPEPGVRTNLRRRSRKPE